MSDQTQATGGNTQTTATGATAATTATEGTTQQTQTAEATATTAATTTETGTGEQTASTATQGAPEKYEFSTPDGKVFDPNVMSVFEASARKHNLTQEVAQGLLGEVGAAVAKRQAEAITQHVEDTKKKWDDAVRSDTEIGGDKLDENLAVAEKALTTFGTPGLKEFLNSTGMSHNPDLIRLLYKVGKTLKEDTGVEGSPQGTGKSAQAFYNASKMNP
jgi:hypothetical protein